jgi:integrase
MATKRRENGTGNVRKDPSRPGSWIGAVQIDGRRFTARGKTKTDVAAKLSRLKAEALTGTGRSRGDLTMTVAQLVDLYLEREVPNLTRNGRPLAPASVGVYEWAAAIITAELGSKRLAKLEVSDVEKMYDRLAKRAVRPLNITSLRKVANKLTAFLTFAEKRGLVTRNVARLATVTPNARAATKRRSMQPDDARRLLEALRAERNGAMFGLSLRLGLRPGEAAGLYWADLDLNGTPPTVNVTRGVRRTHNGAAEVADDLKTSASKRTLAIPEDLAAWLREHRATQRLERVAAPQWDDDRLVFASTTGSVLDPTKRGEHLDVVCARAGVPRVMPNELRHSCASLLADEGVPNEAIADLLGHTTTRMVDQTYRHRLRPVVDVATRATWTRAN